MGVLGGQPMLKYRMLQMSCRCLTNAADQLETAGVSHSRYQRVCSGACKHKTLPSWLSSHGKQTGLYGSRQLSCKKGQSEVQAAGEGPWTLDEAGSRKEWQRDDIRVVLVNPQIPQNAGCVARTCAATSVALHLCGPLGFEVSDAKLKRAGLDYWPFVVVKVHESWEAFKEYFEAQPGPKRMIAFSKFGTQHYAAEGTYQKGDWLLFGAETTGLPPEAHNAAVATGGKVVRIPMIEKHVRSINLAVSAGVGLYEALRQLDGGDTAAGLEHGIVAHDDVS